MPGTRSVNPRERLPLWARGLDAVTVALLALAAYVQLFDGIRLVRGGMRLSITSPLRLCLEAALVAGLRHWRRPRPTIIEDVAEGGAAAVGTIGRARRWIVARSAALTPALAITAGTRLSVLLVGIVAMSTIGYRADGVPEWQVSKNAIANLPARWDSGWYLGIAERGYDYNPEMHIQQNLAFFPVFPSLMRAADVLLHYPETSDAKTLWSGVLVSILAFIPALMYLYGLARDLIGGEEAVVALTLLAAYPFAVFYSAAYTESVFLLAVAGTFYHFLRGQLWRAAAWGLVTGLTRPNGWMLSASLGLLALSSLGPIGAAVARVLPRASRANIAAPARPPHPVALLAAAAAPLGGLALYCGYVYMLTGDPFTWAHLMIYWNRDFHGLQLLALNVAAFRETSPIEFIARHPYDALNAMGLLFGLVTIWPVGRRLGLAYAVFVLANIALPALSGGLESIGRYSSVLFPSFIWLAAATPKAVRPALVGVFALGQGLAAALFFTWRAVY